MMKARRFVNAVTETGTSLCRIKLKNNLFYPSTAEAQQHALAATASKATAAPLQEGDYGELPLPRPRLDFKPSSRPSHTFLKFLPFYGHRAGGYGEGNVLCVDESGLAALYDAHARTVELMPARLGTPRMYQPISCAVTDKADAADPARPDALYVMDGACQSFEALVYGNPGPSYRRRLTFGGGERYAWHWRTLPTPPIEDPDSRFVQCYALLHGQDDDDGATICVSFSRRGRDGDGPAGTYCFDTASREWSKAGDWTLPFFSRAHHAPELGDGLLFGLENEAPFRFCAMDVSGAMKTVNRAPVLRHAWQDIDPPEEWKPSGGSVAYLGDGRFCVHRSFDIMADGEYGDMDTVDWVTLLTGVEVVRAPGSSRLRLVKHKSKSLDCDIEYVL